MHAPTRQVTEFDDACTELVRDMFATMEAAEGVGLAANQVGVDLAVFVFDCPDDDHVRHVGVVCNPEVILPEGKDRKLDDRRRGLPVAARRLRGAGPARPRRLPGPGRDGDPVEVRGTGLLARCLQHETDHLNGTVFGDRLSGRARKKLYAQHEELADIYPDDWPVQLRRRRRTEQRVAGDRRGGGHVERVDAGLHRDLGPYVGPVGPVRDRPAPSVPSMHRHPLPGSQACRRPPTEVDGILGQGQRHGGEARRPSSSGVPPSRSAGPRAG